LRIKGLDFLRAIAILLVLFRHSGLDNFIAHAGWAGVDLFFVLSGFLVSSLLFSEYKKRNSVDVIRFLIRRGFKIYPSFYLFLAVSIILNRILIHSWPQFTKVIAEVFFVQNYLPSLYYHTWSLAVEEHFYMLLAIIILLAVKLRFLENRKFFFSIIIGFILIVSIFRIQFTLRNYSSDFLALFATHYRIDGLFVGFFVSYIYHFNYQIVVFIQRNIWFHVILAATLIAPLFIFSAGGHVMNLIGINSIQIGFGLLLITVITFPYTVLIPNVLLPFYRLVCYIGIYSYSIYLWHIFILEFIENHFGKGLFAVFAFFLLSILIGIVTSLIIENPFLQLRDKLFPKRQGSQVGL